MIHIAHRINTKKELENVPKHQGVEVDIRYEGQDLILVHDPYLPGESLDNYLEAFDHAFIILNTKSEGMEDKLAQLMSKHNITEFFFLDLSIPYMIKTINKGIKNIAVRFSDYEPLEFVLKFKDKVDWVWIDCFQELPLTQTVYDQLKPHFKLCLVSPELQGHSLEKIQLFKQQLEGMPCDAVCTKRPDLWQ